MSIASPPFNLEELRGRVQQLDGDTWQIERTLKSAPYGETQIVRRGDTGAGPYIRKLLENNSGQGSAYETIYRAQSAGTRFSHVPFIYDCTKTDTGIAVVMELVPGKTLREYVAENGAGDDMVRFAAPALCEALVEIHTALDAPIIHRDIKPGNLMASSTGITFIDLDITRTWQEGAEHDTARFGTPGYAPPEQYGFGQTGIAGDLFAAGMTLAFCCTGEDPTTALTESGFRDGRIPTWIRPILVRATQFDPAARYQSAKEMLADVQAAMAGKQLRWNAEPNPGTPTASDSTPESNSSTLIRALKYVWNIFWISVFLIMFIVLVQETHLLFTDEWAEAMIVMQDHPGRVILAIVQLFALYPTFAVALYLMLFKVHRDKLGPLSKLSWKRELPIGAGFIAFVLFFIFYASDYLLTML